MVKLCCAFPDVDECTTGSHNCHANATCTNIDGTYSCACISGYEGNGTTCTGMQANVETNK